MNTFLRRSWKIVVPLLLILSAIIGWKVMHPVLTDEQQIAANLDGLQQAVKNRSANGILRYLSTGFQWNNLSRKDIGSYLGGFFWQARDVNLDLTGNATTVEGDDATTRGRFYLSYKPTPESILESKSGTYTAHWKRTNGTWMLVRVEGGENVGGLP